VNLDSLSVSNSETFGRSVKLALFGEAKAPPTEFLLFGMGTNETENGLVVVNEESIRLSLEWIQTYGNRLPINYGHFGSDDEDVIIDPAEAYKSAGSFDLSFRPTGIWASDVRWTPKADRMIRDEEYLYSSPEIWIDPVTRQLLGVYGCALTNSPATRRMRRLLASRSLPRAGAPIPQQGEPSPMGHDYKLLLSKAGIAPAEAETLAFGISEHARATKELLSVTGASTISEALGRLTGLAEAAVERDQLKETLAVRDADAVKTRIKLALDKACQPDDKGRVKCTPAERASYERAAFQNKSGLVPTVADAEWLEGHLSVKSYSIEVAATPAAKPETTGPSAAPEVSIAKHDGKTWAELSYQARHELFTTDRALYDLLKSQNQARLPLTLS
jgi:Mu-like prophage I protein